MKRRRVVKYNPNYRGAKANVDAFLKTMKVASRGLNEVADVLGPNADPKVRAQLNTAMRAAFASRKAAKDLSNMLRRYA